MSIFAKLKTNHLFVILLVIFIVWFAFKLSEPSSLQQKNQLSANRPHEDSEVGSAHQDRAQTSSTTINLNELFHMGACLLREAGHRIVRIRGESTELSYDRKKADNSIVTKADLQSHTIIVHTLNNKFKGLHVFSEEVR